MINLEENVSLKPYNTFGIEAQTRYLVEVKTRQDLEDALCWFIEEFEDLRDLLVLGGGSNVLFTNDWGGLVLVINLTGCEIVSENEDHVIVRGQAGEHWDAFVAWTVENNWGGLENLSLIPGNVGTSPIQNIGAYGVELKDVFVSLEAFNLETNRVETFDLADCQFGYRDSVFKNIYKGKYVILSVDFKLDKTPVLKLNYGAIKSELKTLEVHNPSVSDVRKAVINIRQSKLPDPKILGSAGSFFKNPVINIADHPYLFKKFPEMPYYEMEEGKYYKIPAGWLIEQCGFKGKNYGNYGVHEKQALVLVNYGGATGEEIWNLAQSIQARVKDKFGVELNPEVNILSY